MTPDIDTSRILRIAWFSPFSNAGVDSCNESTRLLLENAPSAWEIELFVDDSCWAEFATQPTAIPNFNNFPIYTFHRAYFRDLEKPFDIFCYNLSDTLNCSFVAYMMNVRPGVVFCYDTTMIELAAARRSHATTGKEVEKSSKKNGLLIGDHYARGWSIEVLSDSFVDATLNLSAATLIVTDSLQASEQFIAQGVKASVKHCLPPVRTINDQQIREMRSQGRAKLALAEDQIIITCAPQRLIENKSHLLLQAFAKLSKSNIKLVCLANDANATAGFKKLTQRLFAVDPEIAKRIIAVEATNENEYCELLAASDIFVGLGFSRTRVQNSTRLAMSVGVATIVSALGPSAEFPNNSCIKIEGGAEELSQLYLSLQELINNPDFREAITYSAKQYARTELEPKLWVANIAKIFADHQKDLEFSKKDFSKVMQRARAGHIENLTQSSTGSGFLNANIIDKAVADFDWNLF